MQLSVEQFLAIAGLAGLVATAIVGLLMRFFFPSYLREKGKNLATLEDIDRITEKVKGIESKFDHLLEDRRATNRMREAAIERRLQAHQDAFKYCGRLCVSAHSRTPDAVTEVGLEARDWWQNNCLYLEPEAREALSTALTVAPRYQQLLVSPPPRFEAQAALLASMWTQLTGLGDVILNAAQLPPLTSAEKINLAGGEGSSTST